MELRNAFSFIKIMLALALGLGDFFPSEFQQLNSVEKLKNNSLFLSSHFYIAVKMMTVIDVSIKGGPVIVGVKVLPSLVYRS